MYGVQVNLEDGSSGTRDCDTAEQCLDIICELLEIDPATKENLLPPSEDPDKPTCLMTRNGVIWYGRRPGVVLQ